MSLRAAWSSPLAVSGLQAAPSGRLSWHNPLDVQGLDRIDVECLADWQACIARKIVNANELVFAHANARKTEIPGCPAHGVTKRHEARSTWACEYSAGLIRRVAGAIDDEV